MLLPRYRDKVFRLCFSMLRDQALAEDITQDIFLYDMMGEDLNGNIIGRHRSTGIGRPRFWDRARYYGEEKRLAAALDAAEAPDPDR